MKEKLDELKKQGAKIYSFSKLGTFNNCQYEYYKSYINKEKGIENVYTLMGSQLHDGIEAIYSNEKTIDNLRDDYSNKLVELDLLGVKFPNEKIGDSWKADIGHFLNNFNKIDKKMLLEKLIVFEIDDGIWMQGYIDSISPSDHGKPFVNIIDWKTSSKFSGKKLQEAGRQLLMYKYGLEKTTNHKVDKIMWFMLKYVYVCHKLKNGKTKQKMCNRGKWVKEIKKSLEKDLHNLGIEEFELELLLDKAIEENKLTYLPTEIQSKYWLEDCVVEYKATEDNLNELKDYVLKTINEIESKNKKNEDEWEPVEIDKYNSFYCSVLCGHRKTCKFYKQYLEENADGFDKKDKKDEFDIFG
ncbi:PD-(D/E)XK nuclease family protein [Rossellomorea marisflavi]|uniref:PD-(D/E)XK nuclease family protein n=1 Tax=Rossellomorea marisflavi TaxID=189381 RepID=UPI0025B0B816|nr:PD-(D/E)XK nuclease family protein [Rossellomorea marisflavi]WJV20810.1 PD-(D/E)XK nuclease family protein [Rossellomorea marisflavi]